MSDLAHAPRGSLHDQDFHAWLEEQSRLLKARRSAGLDWDALAEELDSLGGSERSEIRSRLVVVLQHLLKWQYQPDRRKTGWQASILEARDQLNERLKDSPSLRPYPASVLAKQYAIARLKAADETGLPLEALPSECPYAIAEILDERFYPEGST